MSRQGPKNTRKTRIRTTELKVRIAPAVTVELHREMLCGQALRACQPLLLPLKHLVHRVSSYSKM